MRTLILPVAVGFVGLSPVAAEMNFDDYWNKAVHSPGVVTKEYPHATVMTDEKDLTVYIFTKPNSPAHPGVIVRKLVNGKGGAYMDTEGHSFGPDSAQPAFQAWMNNPFN